MALGCLEGRTIDQEFAYTLVIDVFITFRLIQIFIRVVGESTRQESRTALASNRV